MCNLKPALYMKGRERPKKEAGHSRLGCGSFKRQEHNQGFSWVAARPVAFCIYPQVYTAALIGLKMYNVQMVSTLYYYFKAVLGQLPA